MRNLLNKELKLTINPFFYILPLIMGLLMLIPGWLYFLVFMYFCFITVPNTLAACKAQNDLSFSILMPVQRNDIVGARVLSFTILELLHIAFGAVFAVINIKLYGEAVFFMTPNVAFFGLGFIMLGLFNLFLFPIFFRSAYKYGVAVTVSTIAAFLFAAGAELLVLFNRELNVFMRYYKGDHWLVLIAGILIFAIMTYISYRISIIRFRKVEA